MRIIDFTNYKLGNINYGGSERKLSIVVPDEAGNQRDYMLKFQKSTPFGKMNNHLSEYIGSHIFEMLGFNVQKTFLGRYQGEAVVACKSFVEAGQQFVPFNDVGESTLDHDRDRYQYEYEEEETERRVFMFPTSQVKLNRKKSSYYEVISSLQFEQCNLALLAVMERMDLAAVLRFVESLDCLSGIHRAFYCHMISARHRMILDRPAAKLLEGTR